MKRVALVYDTLEELIHDKTVSNGMYVNTLGNKSIGDGYGRGYLISEKSEDESVKLDSGLYAIPYITSSDFNLELEKSIRDEDNTSIKKYIEKLVTEICEDISTEFVTKSKEGES